ncbi:MAG: hypothetical protein J6L71_03890 [Clostridia bacterium]|nr:hypothetical protein [Clostridia bacterium]
MKKIICKVEYDTDNATIVEKRTFGAFGDPAGYEETLYMTPNGKFFLYVNGGAESIYPEENIKRLSADKANEWKNS